MLNDYLKQLPPPQQDVSREWLIQSRDSISNLSLDTTPFKSLPGINAVFTNLAAIVESSPTYLIFVMGVCAKECIPYTRQHHVVMRLADAYNAIDTPYDDYESIAKRRPSPELADFEVRTEQNFERDLERFSGLLVQVSRALANGQKQEEKMVELVLRKYINFRSWERRKQLNITPENDPGDEKFRVVYNEVLIDFCDFIASMLQDRFRYTNRLVA